MSTIAPTHALGSGSLNNYAAGNYHAGSSNLFNALFTAGEFTLVWNEKILSSSTGMGVLLELGRQLWVATTGTSGARVISVGTASANNLDPDTQFVNTGSGVSLDVWHRIHVTYKSSTGVCKIYVDGVLMGTSAPGNVIPAFTSSTTLFIGNESVPTIFAYGTSGYLRQWQNDIQLWDHAFDDAEVALGFSGTDIVPADTTTAGLLMAYPLDEGSGLTVAEVCTSSTHLTLSGSPFNLSFSSGNDEWLTDSPSYSGGGGGSGMAIQEDVTDQFASIFLRQGHTQGVRVSALKADGTALNMTGADAKLIARYSGSRDEAPRIISRDMVGPGDSTGLLVFEFEVADTVVIPVGTWVYEIAISIDSYVADVRCVQHGALIMQSSLLGA